MDKVMQFEDADIMGVVRALAREEGILAGGSSGANVWGAIELAKTLKPAKGQTIRIVTILCDSGVKYLSKMFNDDWMKDNGLQAILDEEAKHVKK